jgi:hypothetical protein
MTTDFSYETRVLMCVNCGAPLDADINGGAFACDYCGVTNHIVPRRTDDTLEPPAREQVDDEVRLSRLRAQAGRPIPPPKSVAKLLRNGMLRSSKLKKAIKLFNSTRKEVESSSDYAASETLTFLTLVLYNNYATENDQKRQRALLESAVEAFELPHHRQFVLAILSRSAVKDGDVKAAKDWLRSCDPYSDDLRADTSYRVGQALIATAEGTFGEVHKLLGAGAQEVPIADGFHPMATILRANAWEKDGRPDMGRTLVSEYLRGGGPYGVEALKFACGIYPHLELCQQSIPA